jgi:hypothetical protein
MITRLNKHFGNHFPEMMQELKKGNVLSWDNNGVSHELSDEHKKHIKELEERNSEFEFKVYAVLDNAANLMGDKVCMTSYLFLSNEGYDISKYDDEIYYAIADVVNKSWGINEMGSILIKTSPFGGPERVGC